MEAQTLRRGRDRRRRRRRASALGVALACSSVVGAFGPPSADAAEPGVRVAGRFTPAPENGSPGAKTTRLYVANARRIVYALFSNNWLRAYDADSLRPLGPALELSGDGWRGTSIVDEQSGDLLIASAQPFVGQSTSSLERIGVSGGRLVSRGRVDLTPALAGRTVSAITRGARDHEFYVVADHLLLDYTVVVTHVEIAGSPGGTGRVAWTHPVPSCQGLPTGDKQKALGYADVTQSLVFACRGFSTYERVLGTVPLPSPNGVMELVVAPGGDGRPQPGTTRFWRFPMILDEQGTSFYDDVSDRLVVFVRNELGGSKDAVVFDARHGAYVGRPSLPVAPINGTGFDAVAGRVYLVTTGWSSFQLLDIRATPVGQGLVFTNLTKAGLAEPPLWPLAVDSARSRVFAAGAGDEFTVLADDVPKFRAPPPADPDGATRDVPEAPGRTGRTFSGGAQGYGARYRLVGGTGALQRNLTGTNSSQQQRPGQRELHAGWLEQLAVRDGEATAGGIAADRDQETTGKDEQDAQEQLGTVPGVPDTNGPRDGRWPYAPAECSDLGDGPVTKAQDDAEVACDAAVPMASFRTALGPVAVADVSVSRTSVDASSRLDKRGVVTTVTSTAEGISLGGGALTIGKVVARATTVAKGRPGTASGTYERHVYDVVANGIAVCRSDGTRECPIDVVRRAVNQVFGTSVQVDFPQPDAALAKGSPGGYQALIRREAARQWEVMALEGERENRLTVPAMTLSFYHDNFTAGRLVLDLAGTEAESYYGIYVLGEAGGGGPVTGGGEGAVTHEGSSGTHVEGAGLAVELGLASDVAKPAKATTRTLIDRIVDSIPGARLLWNGLRWFWRTFAMWSLLLAPVYFSARRWELLNRTGLAPEREA